ALGLDGGSFELRLDAAIESGRSWELPVALAHALAARGAEITTTEPDLVVWATGALDPDLKVKPDDYHVADKLALSRSALAEFSAAGARIALLLPPGEDGRFAGPDDPASLADAVVRSVASLAAAIGAVEPDGGGRSARGRVSVLAGSGPEADKAWPRLLAMVFAVVLAVAVGALLIWRPFAPGPVVPSDPGPQQNADGGQNAANAADGGTVLAGHGGDAGGAPVDGGSPQDQTEDVAALLPGLEIVARRDPAKRGCISYLFREGATEDTVVMRSGNGFGVGSRRDLCAIAIKLGAADETADLALSDGLASLVIESARKAAIRLQSGQVIDLPLVQGGAEALSLVIEREAPERPGYRLRLAAEE
ncbi:MAG: hypothetical protein KDJ16_17345, partial [Hyphomicrobiales bacterium]|nr:hypothetical protein [Hyphomicrobiales bacterium]